MEKNIQSRKKYLIAAVSVVVLFALQYLFSWLGGYISRLFDYSSVDNDGLFMQVSVHHIVQMACALIVIILLNRLAKIGGFKLRPEYDPKGIKYTVIFCAVLLLYYLGAYIVGHFTQMISTYDYELNSTNVIGTLGFQLFLSGPSEEILFRSLPVAFLIYVLKPDSRKDRVIAIACAAVLFGLAHIDFPTLTIPWFQVCYAFILGLAYGFTLVRTKSIIYPMIMHSMSNVISVGGCYLYMLIVR